MANFNYPHHHQGYGGYGAPPPPSPYGSDGSSYGSGPPPPAPPPQQGAGYHPPRYPPHSPLPPSMYQPGNLGGGPEFSSPMPLNYPPFSPSPTSPYPSYDTTSRTYGQSAGPGNAPSPIRDGPSPSPHAPYYHHHAQQSPYPYMPDGQPYPNNNPIPPPSHHQHHYGRPALDNNMYFRYPRDPVMPSTAYPVGTPGWHESIRNEAEQAFFNADRDQSGYLDVQEFYEVIRNLVGSLVSYQDALHYFAKTDSDRNGRISLNEFVLLYVNEIARRRY